MPDYSNGKVYKIVCNETGLIYVGSTCEPTLARRLAKHVGNYKNWKEEKHYKAYTTSFKILENKNYDIVLLENCSCDSKDQLYARERHYIETLNCVNKIIVGRTQKEYGEIYRDKNKEKRKKQYKDYYEQNKDKLKENRKLYQELNQYKIKEWKSLKCICVCGGKYNLSGRSQHLKSVMHNEYIKTQEG